MLEQTLQLRARVPVDVLELVVDLPEAVDEPLDQRPDASEVGRGDHHLSPRAQSMESAPQGRVGHCGGQMLDQLDRADGIERFEIFGQLTRMTGEEVTPGTAISVDR